LLRHREPEWILENKEKGSLAGEKPPEGFLFSYLGESVAGQVILNRD